MKKLLTLYLILSAFVSFAQNKMTDSLQQALKDFDAKKTQLHKSLSPDEGDTAKVILLKNLSWQYIQAADYTPGRKYADEGLALAQQIHYKSGIAKCYNNIGLIYWYQGNNPEALKNYLASLKIMEELGDKSSIAKSYNNIGNFYWFQGNFPEALKSHSASLKISEELGDKIGMGRSYGNLGGTYASQGNLPEALKNHLAALKLREETGDINGIASSYGNIGNIYSEQGNYPEALKNYFAGLKLMEETGDKNGIIGTYTGIGVAKLKMQATAEGKGWLLKALQLTEGIGVGDNLKNIYQYLSQADSALGNFKGAYDNHKLFILYRDSLVNEENSKKITQQQMQYDFDKKESATKAEQDKKDAIALKELQKQKLIRNGFTGGFAIVLLFAGVFFTQRNKISKGKKRSDELLLNILPEEVAAELKAKGSADAKQFDDVTVMFTDFKNFTQISEKLSPTELVNEIHTCFKAFDDIIGKHNIEKIKTIGDSYMCAGGLPVSNTTNATDVVNAAMEIQQFMQQHLQQRKNEGKEVFEIRIGVHTGPVVAGIVGVKKFAYDIWGDTVNIASRMESSGEAGKVNISGSTYELVKDKFSCTHRGKIQAKNKGEIDMYFAEPGINQ